MLAFSKMDVTRRGGRRRGAGRKPRGEGRLGPVHRSRERFTARDAARVSLRVASEVNLRSDAMFAVVSRVLREAREAFGFRIVHFSLKRNVVLLVAEAGNWRALSRGAKGLSVRIARAVNALLARRGQLFPHRYEATILRRPFDARRALVQVLNAAPKPARGWLDPFSSAAWFDGWANAALAADARGEPPGIVPPRGWLLSSGWRMHGRVRVDELPR